MARTTLSVFDLVTLAKASILLMDFSLVNAASMMLGLYFLSMSMSFNSISRLLRVSGSLQIRTNLKPKE